jgi:glucose/arabinose dehydrogenase
MSRLSGRTSICTCAVGLLALPTAVLLSGCANEPADSSDATPGLSATPSNTTTAGDTANTGMEMPTGAQPTSSGVPTPTAIPTPSETAPVPTATATPTLDPTAPLPTPSGTAEPAPTAAPTTTDTGPEPTGPEPTGPAPTGPEPTGPEPTGSGTAAPDMSTPAEGGPRPAPPLGTWPPPALKFTEISQATQPTAIAAPRGDTSRLYFTEKWGIVRVIKDGVLLEEPALDMREAVLEGGPQGSTGPEMQNQGKRGLVGLAFHPDYEANGRIFVMYTADQGIPGYGTVDHSNLYDDGDMTFAEYRRSADNPDKFDPEPVEVFLQFDKGNCDQCSQHNGGSLEVGVDGFLWASTGDPPPYDNPGSQDLNNLNGKLLRFDISGASVTAAGNYPGADPYVWSIGIRNAYKFSIDRYTGDMYVADVGENSWEEITVERYGEGHKDHGWPKTEGFQSFMSLECGEDNCLDPIFDYGHQGMEGTPGADNCIVGGYVYRGSAIPELQGAYIYGDNGSQKLRALQVENGELLNGPQELGLTVNMGCFGEDAAGEMYVCDYDGRILRLDAQ